MQGRRRQGEDGRFGGIEYIRAYAATTKLMPSVVMPQICKVILKLKGSEISLLKIYNWIILGECITSFKVIKH